MGFFQSDFFKIKQFFFVGFICFNTQLSAQFNFIDTFKFYTSKESSFFVDFDGRNSFISDRPASIGGAVAGLSFQNVINIYAGIYWNKNQILSTETINIALPNQTTLHYQYRMFYVAATLEYAFYKTNKWYLSVPFQTGIGGGYRYTLINSNEKTDKLSHIFVPIEASFRARYYILDRLSASAGVGIRYALFSKVFSDQFSAPTYNYGIGIVPNVFYKRFLKKPYEKYKKLKR